MGLRDVGGDGRSGNGGRGVGRWCAWGEGRWLSQLHGSSMCSRRPRVAPCWVGCPRGGEVFGYQGFWGRGKFCSWV
jgi:hypothetical protein